MDFGRAIEAGLDTADDCVYHIPDIVIFDGFCGRPRNTLLFIYPIIFGFHNSQTSKHSTSYLLFSDPALLSSVLTEMILFKSFGFQPNRRTECGTPGRSKFSIDDTLVIRELGSLWLV